MKACGVGVAHSIEPVQRLFFGITRTGEQTVYELFVRIRSFFIHECIHFGRRRRQARQIKRDAANQRAAVGFGRGLQPSFCKPRLDEGINGIADRGLRIGDGGNSGALDGLIGPMTFVHCAFGDPTFDEFFLLRGQVFVRVFRRHHFVLVGRKDAADDFTFVRFAGDYGCNTGFGFLRRFFAEVKPQSRFARAFVGAVTQKAGIGQNRANVSIKADGVLRDSRDFIGGSDDESR